MTWTLPGLAPTEIRSQADMAAWMQVVERNRLTGGKPSPKMTYMTTPTKPITVAVPANTPIRSKDGKTYAKVSEVLGAALIHVFDAATDDLLTIKVVESNGKVTTIHDHKDEA